MTVLSEHIYKKDVVESTNDFLFTIQVNDEWYDLDDGEGL